MTYGALLAIALAAITPKPRGRWRVGDPLPVLMTDQDLMEVLGVKSSRFYLLKADGCFDLVLVRRLETSRGEPVGTKKPYSGALVQLWIDGGGLKNRSYFGMRKRAS